MNLYARHIYAHDFYKYWTDEVVKFVERFRSRVREWHKDIELSHMQWLVDDHAGVSFIRFSLDVGLEHPAMARPDIVVTTLKGGLAVLMFKDLEEIGVVTYEMLYVSPELDLAELKRWVLDALEVGGLDMNGSWPRLPGVKVEFTGGTNR